MEPVKHVHLIIEHKVLKGKYVLTIIVIHLKEYFNLVNANNVKSLDILPKMGETACLISVSKDNLSMPEVIVNNVHSIPSHPFSLRCYVYNRYAKKLKNSNWMEIVFQQIMTS